MGYQERRAWSDNFLPEICRIVGPRILEPTPFLIDAREASDLMVLEARNLKIACRVRSAGYLYQPRPPSYKYQFTLRSEYTSGAKTEKEKILDGFGDLMFYGHQLGDTHSFDLWMLIDLHAFRTHVALGNHGDELDHQIPNADGETYLTPIDIRNGYLKPPRILKDYGGPFIENRKCG